VGTAAQDRKGRGQKRRELPSDDEEEDEEEEERGGRRHGRGDGAGGVDRKVPAVERLIFWL
jgi:hypothetical protein